VRVSDTGKGVKFAPTVTSNKRSLMGIAMANGCLDICRYLVAEKGLTIATERDVTVDMLRNSLETVLRTVPRSAVAGWERNGEQGDEAAAASTDIDPSYDDETLGGDLAGADLALRSSEMELRAGECAFLLLTVPSPNPTNACGVVLARMTLTRSLYFICCD
jgi:hypothetical protein